MTVYFIAEMESAGQVGRSFVHLRPNGIFKVGYTKAPEAGLRVYNLQIGNPRPIRTFRELAGNHQDEQRLHMMLAPLRLQGEWFRLPARFVEVLRLTRPNWDVNAFMDALGGAYLHAWETFAVLPLDAAQETR